MSNFIVLLERQGLPLQRLQLVARDKAAAILTALELAGADSQTKASVVLEGHW